ncbi:MAG TPA: hypothetical protein VLA14_05655 [Polyangia bacterium]|nr:hypothetical protein [Polyangia bacterium]
MSRARGPRRGARRASILSRLQLGLEALYRVRTDLSVDAFVIDEAQRREAGVARAPREQLLVREEDGELGLALFVDGAALANLERHDPNLGLDDANFADFCLALEGVSHFVYLALCAAGHRRVSALELELQAEVDKFVCCVLLQAGAVDKIQLRERLFREVRFHDDLDAEERDRYQTANAEAARYAEGLERRFVRRDRVDDMLGELRRFYRLGLDAKRGLIARHAG